MNIFHKLSIWKAIIYPIVFVLSYFGPLVAKSIINPPVGPSTAFFTAIVICPVAFLLLGLCFGRLFLLIHSSLILLGIFWIFITYPSDPLMDFPREMANNVLPTKLVVIYFSGFIFYLGRWAFLKIVRKNEF